MPYEAVGRGRSVVLYCNDYKENRFCLCPETVGHSIKWFKFEDGTKTEITEVSLKKLIYQIVFETKYYF